MKAAIEHVEQSTPSASVEPAAVMVAVSSVRYQAPKLR